jgi:hypothetical protein
VRLTKTTSRIPASHGPEQYPTKEKNLFRYIPQRRKISSIVGYNGRKPAALWDTMQKIFLCWIPQFFCVVHIVGYSTLHQILLYCRIQRKKNSCIVGYKGKNLLPVLRFFSVVFHNGKNLFRCIPQRRKTFSIVSHNGKKIFCCIPQ